MDNFNISRKIVECRQKKGINQEELADFIGVSKASVSKWERGHSFPEITFLPLLASYFDITIDELMGYEPQMSKENIRTLLNFLSRRYSAIVRRLSKNTILVTLYYFKWPTYI